MLNIRYYFTTYFSLFFAFLSIKTNDLYNTAVSAGLDLRTKVYKTNIASKVSSRCLPLTAYGNLTLLILIDNYDSFTWNLWHFLSDLGAKVEIVRNDAVSADNIIARNPEGIIVSPGPGIPENAGITMALILAAKEAGTPLLGVCLGHQALAVAFGAAIKRVDPPVHGKLSLVEKTHSRAVKSDILALCPNEFPVTRYHSLVVDEASLSDKLTVTARTAAGAIMGLSHVEAELHGVQFHPESIASVAGYRILASFLQICGHGITSDAALDALEAQILRLDQRFPDQMHA
jgi:anthranilate synthase/aminodeoxychorismate synthase-like glutamine amidotransferase